MPDPQCYLFQISHTMVSQVLVTSTSHKHKRRDMKTEKNFLKSVKGFVTNSWSREETVQNLGLKKKRMVKSPNTKQSVRGAKGAARSRNMVHRKVPWKMENSQGTEVMGAQHLPKENAVGNSRAKPGACKDWHCWRGRMEGMRMRDRWGKSPGEFWFN